jgi:hypothetical protein
MWNRQWDQQDDARGEIRRQLCGGLKRCRRFTHIGEQNIDPKRGGLFGRIPNEGLKAANS